MNNSEKKKEGVYESFEMNPEMELITHLLKAPVWLFPIRRVERMPFAVNEG